MSRWKRGEATVAKLLIDRHLQRISGEMSEGQAWLDKAGRTLSSAGLVVDSDPESALVLPTTPDVRSAPASSLSRVCGPRPPAGTSP
jgi:hypothetical protein